MFRWLGYITTAMVLPFWFALSGMMYPDEALLNRMMWLAAAIVFLPLYIVGLPFHYLLCKFVSNQ